MGVEREIRVPDIGDFRDVDVIELLVAPGDRVAVESSLVALESDKATMEIPSPVAGVVKELLVRVGDKVSEGSPIARIELADEAAVEAPPPAAAERPARRTAAAPGPTPAPVPARPAAPARAAAEPRPPAELRASYAFAPEDLDAEAPRGPRSHASPSVRRLARELGVDLERVPASGPKGR